MYISVEKRVHHFITDHYASVALPNIFRLRTELARDPSWSVFPSIETLHHRHHRSITSLLTRSNNSSITFSLR